MVLQNVVQHKQPLPGHHPQVILSKEARVAVAAERDKRSENFRNALNTTWEQLNESTVKVASTHHKSVKRVRRDLFLGHGALSTQRNKINAWNAFCWKKGCDNRAEGQHV